MLCLFKVIQIFYYNSNSIKENPRKKYTIKSRDFCIDRIKIAHIIFFNYVNYINAKKIDLKI